MPNRHMMGRSLSSRTTGLRPDRNVNTRGKDLNTIVTDDIILDRVSTQRLRDHTLKPTL